MELDLLDIPVVVIFFVGGASTHRRFILNSPRWRPEVRGQMLSKISSLTEGSSSTEVLNFSVISAHKKRRSKMKKYLLLLLW